MVFVVFRNGTVVRYNTGGAIAETEQSYVIQTYDQKHLVARVPIALVERIEFNRPCAVLRTKRPPRRRSY